MSEQKAASLPVANRRVLCADGVIHYRWGQDVSTFKDVETALAWADEFSGTPGVGQGCGPHKIGAPE